jgi:hypothetical protein
VAAWVHTVNSAARNSEEVGAAAKGRPAGGRLVRAATDASAPLMPDQMAVADTPV